MNIDIDAAKMFPEAARRVEILETLQRSWAGVVGARLANVSRPCVLGVNELCVTARDGQAAAMLRNMKGNITRALSRHGYNAAQDFTLKILPEHVKRPAFMRKSKRAVTQVKVNEDIVKEYMKNAPENLPEDINYSVSHLKAFLEKRFPNKK